MVEDRVRDKVSKLFYIYLAAARLEMLGGYVQGEIPIAVVSIPNDARRIFHGVAASHLPRGRGSMFRPHTFRRRRRRRRRDARLGRSDGLQRCVPLAGNWSRKPELCARSQDVICRRHIARADSFTSTFTRLSLSPSLPSFLSLCLSLHLSLCVCLCVSFALLLFRHRADSTMILNPFSYLNLFK